MTGSACERYRQPERTERTATAQLTGSASQAAVFLVKNWGRFGEAWWRGVVVSALCSRSSRRRALKRRNDRVDCNQGTIAIKAQSIGGDCNLANFSEVGVFL